MLFFETQQIIKIKLSNDFITLLCLDWHETQFLSNTFENIFKSKDLSTINW